MSQTLTDDRHGGAEPPGGDGDPRRALTTLALVVAGMVVLAMSRPGLAGTIAVMLSIILMIMLHELGHFVMAKRAGMKVTEFFLGFGPKLWSIRRGETEYGVKAIPAGGYVRIIGMNNIEEVDPADEERTYRAKPYRHRLGVAVAGSTMHFIIATILLFIIYAAVGLPDVRSAVGTVVKGSPAEAAGLEAGDRILAIDDRKIDDWEQIPDYIRSAPGGEPVVFTVQRDGERLEVPVTPKMVGKGDQKVPQVGITADTFLRKKPVFTAVSDTVTEMPKWTWRTIEALGGVFSPAGLSNWSDMLSGNEGKNDSRVLSPVGATRFASDAVAGGWGPVLFFLFQINIFVGIFNMVPLLPLDGGHVAIASYEKIASMRTGRRVQVDVRRLIPITMAVVMVLVVVGISALYLDIVNPVEMP